MDETWIRRPAPGWHGSPQVAEQALAAGDLGREIGVGFGGGGHEGFETGMDRDRSHSPRPAPGRQLAGSPRSRRGLLAAKSGKRSARAARPISEEWVGTMVRPLFEQQVDQDPSMVQLPWTSASALEGQSACDPPFGIYGLVPAQLTEKIRRACGDAQFVGTGRGEAAEGESLDTQGVGPAEILMHNA